MTYPQSPSGMGTVVVCRTSNFLLSRDSHEAAYDKED